jgi:LDH2 family malate/lactate/ureidoglycolate dehydrogenase
MEIEKGSIWMKFEVVERFMRDVFKGLGVPAKEAAVSAEVLITADSWASTPTAFPG